MKELSVKKGDQCTNSLFDKIWYILTSLKLIILVENIRKGNWTQGYNDRHGRGFGPGSFQNLKPPNKICLTLQKNSVHPELQTALLHTSNFVARHCVDFLSGKR